MAIKFLEEFLNLIGEISKIILGRFDERIPGVNSEGTRRLLDITEKDYEMFSILPRNYFREISEGGLDGKSTEVSKRKTHEGISKKKKHGDIFEARILEFFEYFLEKNC